MNDSLTRDVANPTLTELGQVSRLLSSGPADDAVELKNYWSGTHRVRHPKETVALLQPKLADYGITRVGRLTGLDRIGVETAVVVRPNARGLAVRHGKGTSWDVAVASGIMESIETWHAERPPVQLQLGSHQDLSRTQTVVDPLSLPRPRSSGYSASEPIMWTAAVNLQDGCNVLVPYEMVHAQFADPVLPGAGMFEASTNGIASGNALCEALIHAICEVIERDATTLFSQRPELDCAQRRLRLDDDDHSEPGRMLRRLEALGFRVVVWDTTTDIGVPCFVTAFIDNERPTTPPGLGAGCHLSPTIALIRSITEAVQTRLTHIAGSRDNFGADLYAQTARIRAQWKLQNADKAPAERPPRRLDCIADKSSRSLLTDLKVLVGALSDAGFADVLAIDLAPRHSDYSVVRAIVPGLEGFNEHGDLELGRRAAIAGGNGP